MGMPEKVVHEWVEAFAEYEAVLVCTNELPVWEADATIRAFAIYQWSDATTSGNDSSLRHNESGTIIRHDGGVLAIEYGDDALSEALPDLFLALYQLGWRGAEVYHPAASLNELLADIGRAIAANLEFDVRPANLGRIGDSSEGLAFVDVASRLKAGVSAAGLAISTPADEVNEAVEVLDVFRSMAPAGGRPGVVNLIDDEAEVSAVSEQLAAMAPARVVPTFGEDDGEPGVPNLDFERVDGGYPVDDKPFEHVRVLTSLKEVAYTDNMQLANTVRENDALRKDHDEITHTMERLGVELDISEQARMRAEKIADEAIANLKINEQLVIDLRAMQAADIVQPVFVPSVNTLCDAPSKTFKVGNSVFCFDFPSDPLTLEDLKVIADDRRIPCEQWVHVRPGELKESVRWDVLGEIDLERPWMVEKLVKIVVPFADERLVSCIFLALRQMAPFAGLRDVLMFAGLNPAEMARSVSRVLPGAETLFRHALARGDLVMVVDTLVQSIGSLVLAPVGQAFVDLPSNGAELSEEMYETFTVRGVIRSPVGRLFVVHVDGIDSTFVTGLVESLRAVIQLQITAERCCCAGVVCEINPIVPEEVVVASEVDNADVKELLGSLVALLEKNGLKVPG